MSELLTATPAVPADAPQERFELTPLSDAPTPEELAAVFATWSAPWEALSPAARAAILDCLPAVHNAVCAQRRQVSGACNPYSAALAQALDARGIPVRLVSGFHHPEIPPGLDENDLNELVDDGELSEDVLDFGGHAWLEVEGLLVDPTASQFLDPGAYGGAVPGEWSRHYYMPTDQYVGAFTGDWEDAVGEPCAGGYDAAGRRHDPVYDSYTPPTPDPVLGSPWEASDIAEEIDDLEVFARPLAQTPEAVFHVAPRRLRGDILRLGLLAPGQPNSAGLQGVYLTDDPSEWLELHDGEAVDIWQVHPEDLLLHHDPEMGMNGDYVFLGSVAPWRLRLTSE